MEQMLTPESLVRRTITKDDGRFLYFYNLPGEDQPIDESGGKAAEPTKESEPAGKETLPNV
jgi:hypothetical protein